MILAAGFGTRLFPLTIDRTKPAIPFLGKPLVGYVAEYVAKFGFREVVVNLHHQPESVKTRSATAHDFGVNIHYTIEEPEILGHGGRARQRASSARRRNFFNRQRQNHHRHRHFQSRRNAQKNRRAGDDGFKAEHQARKIYRSVDTKDGLITGFGDFPAAFSRRTNLRLRLPKLDSPLMFTGIHILEPRVFEYIPRGVYSDIVPTFYNPAIEKRRKNRRARDRRQLVRAFDHSALSRYQSGDDERHRMSARAKTAGFRQTRRVSEIRLFGTMFPIGEGAQSEPHDYRRRRQHQSRRSI